MISEISKIFYSIFPWKGGEGDFCNYFNAKQQFVNNIKLDNELDKTNLKNKLIELIHNKNLTKKEKVKYDQINGKIISLIDLQYIDGKYII